MDERFDCKEKTQKKQNSGGKCFVSFSLINVNKNQLRLRLTRILNLVLMELNIKRQSNLNIHSNGNSYDKVELNVIDNLIKKFRGGMFIILVFPTIKKNTFGIIMHKIQ